MPNSSAIESKKVPKVYAVPKAVPFAIAAAIAAIQARDESGSIEGSGIS